MSIQIPNELKNVGFDHPKSVKHKTLIVSICGLEKQGKTHFSLTAPPPIAIFNIDIGTEGVVDKFKDDKVIMEKELFVPEDGEAAKEEWDKFYKAYKAVLNTKHVRTIIFDTATELWELLRMARFGKLSQVLPVMYGPVNAEFRKVLRDAYDTPDKTLILLHKMKPVYINDKRTNKYERSGFSDTGYLVQANCEVYRNPGEEGNTNPDFNLMVLDCRQNEKLVGEVLSGPVCNFPFLASLIVEGTTPEDWE